MTSGKCLDQWSTHDVLTYCDEHTLFKMKCINRIFHENSSSLINKSVIMYQKIINQKQFQIIFDVMCSDVDVICMTFDKSINNTSINFGLLALNKTREILMCAKLQFDGFIQKSHTISINAKKFHKYLKTQQPNSSTYMSILHNNPNILQLIFQHNDDISTSACTLYDELSPNIEFPSIAFDMKITMDAMNFHNMCKEMIASKGDLLEIIFASNKLMFICRDTTYDSINRTYVNNEKYKLTYHNVEENSEIQIEFDHPESIEYLHQVYHLINIVKFTKYVTLSEKMEIYLNKRKYPIALKYMTTCGEIIIYMSPSESFNPKLYDRQDNGQ